MTLFDLINKVLSWADEKGILKEGNERAQAAKTVEEVNELESAIIVNDRQEIKDGIGDALVTLIIQAEMQGLSLAECLDHAYDQIKDREGKMINGTFVKNNP